MASERDARRRACVDKATAEIDSLVARGALMGGNAFSAVLLVKGDLSDAEKDGAPAFSGADGKALRASLERLGYAPEDWEWLLAVDADGVHVGQSDIQGRDIRALIGPDRILGMTARTVEEARAAEAAGADYIGSGAVFGSSTKKNAKNLPLETLRDICASVSIPVVAIGGIGKENIRELAGCGIAGAAVVSAVFGAEDPGRAAEELLALSREIIRHA